MTSYHKTSILQVLPSLIAGGVERGTIDISKELVRQGFGSFVASSGGPLAHDITLHNAAHLTMPLDSKNPLQIYRNSVLIADIVKQNNINIIHARSRAPAWSSYFAAKRTKAHFITTFHGTYGFNNFLKKYYNSIMVSGERIIAVSEFIRRHILENYNIDENKIRLIHRGVDTDVFDPAKVDKDKLELLRAKYAIPKGVPVILLPGRFSRWKGQLFLAEALGKLKNKEFFCLMVGDKSKHPDFVKILNSKLEELDIKNKVQLEEPEYDMISLYSIADIVISASVRPEAFGRIAIEAGSMEKLLIATNIGGACETVENNVSGFHVEPNKINDLADKISYALSIIGTDLEQKITRAARNSIMAKFSLTLMKQKTLDVYKELL